MASTKFIIHNLTVHEFEGSELSASVMHANFLTVDSLNVEHLQANFINGKAISGSVAWGIELLDITSIPKHQMSFASDVDSLAVQDLTVNSLRVDTATVTTLHVHSLYVKTINGKKFDSDITPMMMIQLHTSGTNAQGPLTEFPFFAKLPIELRLIVWSLALPASRVVTISLQPTYITNHIYTYNQRKPTSIEEVWAGEHSHVHVSGDRTPSILHVNRESRNCASKSYVPAFGPLLDNTPIFINFVKELFSSKTLRRLRFSRVLVTTLIV